MPGETQSAQIIRFGVYEFDPETAELRKAGLKIKLQGQPVEVLRLLLEKPGRVVTREEFHERLWTENTFVDFEHGLNAAVQKLREILGDSANNPRFVETLPRRGYRFVFPVEGTGTDKTVVPKWVWVTGGSLAALILLTVGLNIGGLQDRLFTNSTPGVGATGRPSFVVLPFVQINGTENTQWMSEGVADMLATGLAQIEGLEVVGGQRLHTAMKQLGLDSNDALEKGRMLEVAQREGAGAILQGNIFHTGSDMRIDIQVEDVESGRLLFAHDVRGEDLFLLVDELTGLIREELKLPGDFQVHPVAEIITTSLEAFRLYSEGREAQAAVRHADARDLYEQAVAIDPSFAMAYYALSRLLGFEGDRASAKDYWQKTLDNINRLPERKRLLILARKANFEGNLTQRIDILERLLARFPDEFGGYNQLWRSYDNLGQPERAREVLERGVKALPYNALLHMFLGYKLLWAGRYAEALRELEANIQLNPREANPYDSLAEAYLIMGQPGKALEKYARALEINPSFFGTHWSQAYAYAMMGQYSEALEEVDAVMEGRANAGLPMTIFHVRKAFILSRVGRLREAEQSIRQGLRSARKFENHVLQGMLEHLSARIALEQGEYRKALHIKRLSLEHQHIPKQPVNVRPFATLVTHKLLGTAEARSGNIGAARENLESMRKLYPKVGESGNMLFHFLEGEIALAEGNLAAAEVAFSAGEPKLKRLFSIIRNGNLFPNNPLSGDWRARVKKARGDLDGAIEAYRELLTPDISDKWTAVLEPRFVLELARLLAQTGDTIAAKKEYQRFLELWKDADPDIPLLLEAKAEYAKLNQ